MITNINKRIAKLEDIVIKKVIRDAMYFYVNLDEEDNEKIEKEQPFSPTDLDKYHDPRMNISVIEKYNCLTNDDIEKYEKYSDEFYIKYKWDKRNGY